MSCGHPADWRTGLMVEGIFGFEWMLIRRVRPSHCDSNARPNDIRDIKKNPLKNGFFLMLFKNSFTD